MAHQHKVNDQDKYFIIDPITRRITNESEKVRLMQFDHNSERLTFEIPRYLDDHDMSLCDKVEVHYINTDGMYANEGIYEVDDLQVSPESEDTVICSWLISRNVTQYVGAVNFALKYSCTVDEVDEYVWHTDIHDSIIVSETINNSDTVVIENADILEQWREKLFGAGDSVIAMIDAKGTEVLQNIEDAQADVISDINAAGQSQIDAIVAKGNEIVGSIPEGGEVLPPVTEKDNGSILQVVNGVWTVVSGGASSLYPSAEGIEF